MAGAHSASVLRVITPASSAPGATVLKTVPHLFTLSCLVRRAQPAGDMTASSRGLSEDIEPGPSPGVPAVARHSNGLSVRGLVSATHVP